MEIRLLLLLFLSQISLNAKELQDYIVGLPSSYNQYFNTHSTPIKSEELLAWKQDPKSLLITSRSFYDSMPSRERKLISDFAYLQVLGLSAIAFLGFVPRETSNWDTEYVYEYGLFKNWLKNIQTPPVVDQDEWAVNYIGHSLGGAFYYTLARNEGFNIAESAFFTFMVSTFYWEYGFEAVFELPSKQDLISTPLLGPILGEVFYQLQLKIKANQGKAFGSKRLGNFFLVFFDPEGALADLLREFFNENNISVDFQIVNYFSSYYTFEYDKRVITGLPPVLEEYYIGFNISITFNIFK